MNPLGLIEVSLGDRHKEIPELDYDYVVSKETIRPTYKITKKVSFPMNRSYGKYEGELFGCPVYSNEDIPKGEIHFYHNDKFIQKVGELKEPTKVFMTKTEYICMWIQLISAIILGVVASYGIIYFFMKG